MQHWREGGGRKEGGMDGVRGVGEGWMEGEGWEGEREEGREGGGREQGRGTFFATSHLGSRG